jgi:Domain of unknown function (DUF4259)
LGAWDSGSFDNDSACDWAYGLEGANDLTPIREAVEKVLAAGADYLESEVAWEALAACEVIARLKGNWGRRNAYSEAVDVWVEAHPIRPPADLVQQALSAIERIESAPSELLELWDEEEPHAEWHAAVADLRARVAG